MPVFVGKQIVVHWNEGRSDFLLVSFNQLNSEHAASEHFFLQPQVEGGAISCIGVMTTERGFYLSPEMEEVRRLVAEKRAGRKVLVFGQSMGGYAALKFSRMLGADYVIAASPFYSVHADDLELPSDRHRRILMRSMAGHGVGERPEFAGMAIRPDDVSGRLVVLYDPAEMIDAYGAALIGKYMPQTEFITVPHSGHVIFDSTWDVRVFVGLLDAVRSPDPALMSRTVSAFRRNQRAFLVRALTKAANRKPALCVAAMKAPRITRHPAYRDLIGDMLNLRAIYLLAERGDHALATAHLATVMQGHYRLDIRPAKRDGAQLPMEMLSSHRCLILSWHGTFLTWDAERDTSRFEPHPFRLTTRLPIVATIRDGVARFTAVANGVEKPVSLTGEGTDQLVENDATTVAIRIGDQFLGATPDGSRQMLPVVAHQQRLIVLPLSDDSKLFEIERANWFDQALQNQAPARPAQEAAPVVQRATQRWRRLFARG